MVFKFDTKFLLNFFKACSSLYKVNIFAYAAYFYLFNILFVKNIAHNFLYKVFHGNNAFCSAVFVYYYSHLNFIFLHILEKLVHFFWKRHKIRLHKYFFNIKIAFIFFSKEQKQITHSEKAYYIVYILIINRYTAEFFFFYEI